MKIGYLKMIQTYLHYIIILVVLFVSPTLSGVNFPTDINSNIIKLVFSSSLHSEQMLNNIFRHDLLSDHFFVSF